MQSLKAILLLATILTLCVFASRLAADAYWIGIHVHRSVKFGRASDAVGQALLWPGRFVLQSGLGLNSGDEMLLARKELIQTNGLVTGLILYLALRKRLLGSSEQSSDHS